MTITLVAAVGSNGVIGRDGGMPWHLPEDLAHFKRVTMGGVLVMGRKTYDSIGRPLPGRTTIVVTRNPDWHADGVRTADSLESALALAGTGREVFVVGGGEIYRQALSVADRVLLTEVRLAPDGDTTFPSLDAGGWAETSREKGEGFDFVTYERRPADRP
jgi:dihydrofolate reductase